MGLTFQPGVQLDTFDLYTGQPHVVADRDHIICDYTGDDGTLPCITEARTFYTQPDTWGGPVPVTDLDTLYSSYYNGAKLAISADGRVHTALMIFDLVGGKDLTYYASSSDHGVTWSNRELINDDTTGDKQEPDIGANSAGHAYVVWRNFLEDDAEIWFSTNNPAGVAEGHKPQAPSTALEAEPSVFRV